MELFLVGNTRGNNVLGFSANTGTLLGEFIPPGSGGLSDPDTLLYGPDVNGDGFEDLYIASGPIESESSVLIFDGTTGAFIDVFVGDDPVTDFNETGGLIRPYGLAFGPDGNFYVSSFLTDEILRYDGATGDFLDVFAVGNGEAGGLNGPNILLFIGDSLYVTTQGSVATFDPETQAPFPDFSAGLPSQVLRYDSLEAGAPPTVFASPEPSSEGFGFVSLLGLALGEDGDLYVSDFANDILRYDLESGELQERLSTNYTQTSPSNNFIGSLAFAPEGDLYTVGFDVSTEAGAVLRYDVGEDGSAIAPFEVLVPTDTRLERPIGITFPTNNTILNPESVLVFGSTGNNALEVGAPLEATIAFGGSGNDLLDTSSTASEVTDRLFAGSGDDELFAGASDRLSGGSGNDVLDASSGGGGNRLSGDSGDDDFFLGSGDRVLGGDGDDRFFALAGGDNTMTGGAGADQFWIANAQFPDASNRITDFELGTDAIGIGGGLAGEIGDLALTADGSDTAIAIAGVTLAVLLGISPEAIAADGTFVFA